MKLFLLRPITGDQESGKWRPWFDKVFGFVVRAESETAARTVAAENCGDEGGDAWTNPLYSTCIQLTADGEAGVVMRDFYAA